MKKRELLNQECTVDPEDYEWYEEFYSEGGWLYEREKEMETLHACIITPLSLKAGLRVLEIGCGVGFHARLWQESGFQVVAVDVSRSGIAHAERTNPGPEYFCVDLATWSPPASSIDLIFARGMAWYHFELSRRNRKGVDVVAQTERLFDFLVPGGVFVLQISTDFSGTVAHSGVLNNRYDDYTGFFSNFGEIILASNWRGKRIRNQSEAELVRGNVIVATRKQT